ncbi:MAG: 50S ribosome-binding GTPase, partial [Nanoarchaeota archaeon]|nr:50S ribosome-binding GTPase [Nanoarchaeota archaeon]
MNFQSLKKIEEPDFYLDLAFRRAQEKAKMSRSSIKIKKDRIEKSKTIELQKIDIIRNVLTDKLSIILRSYPMIDDLPEFYKRLIMYTLDYDELKRALGAIKWVIDKIDGFSSMYIGHIKKTQHFEKINTYRSEYYGRISSLLKQIKGQLKYIEEARRTMKEFPAVKTSLSTACIVGFPNIGKTTLLFKLTGSKPEIAAYSFTTKGINISYLEGEGKKIQLLDTPGTLNRDKMNNIEMQSYLALRTCADIIIYIIDLTETYPLEDQLKMLKMLSGYKKPIYIYLSKTDILDADKVKEFKKKY